MSYRYRLTLGTGVSAVLHIDIMWVHVKLYLLYPLIHIQVLTYLLQNWCEQESSIYILLVKMQKFYILVFVLHGIMSVENPNRWSIPWFRSIWARISGLTYQQALMKPIYISNSHAFSTKECLFGSVASDGFWVERLWLSGVFWAILRLLFSLGLFWFTARLASCISGFWATKARTVYNGVRNNHQVVFASSLIVLPDLWITPAPLYYWFLCVAEVFDSPKWFLQLHWLPKLSVR